SPPKPKLPLPLDVVLALAPFPAIRTCTPTSGRSPALGTPSRSSSSKMLPLIMLFADPVAGPVGGAGALLPAVVPLPATGPCPGPVAGVGRAGVAAIGTATVMSRASPTASDVRYERMKAASEWSGGSAFEQLGRAHR